MRVWSVTGEVPSKIESGSRRRGFVVAIAMSVALSGCKVFVKSEPPPCPRFSILAETSSLTRFASGAATQPGNMIVNAKLVNYTGSCFYDSDRRIESVSVAVDIDATRGPAMKGDTITLPYYVAVPTYFPDAKGKKLMSVALTFPAGADHVRLKDEPVYVEFPVVAERPTEAQTGMGINDLAKYEIFVGWQLDASELSYNRKTAPSP